MMIRTSDGKTLGEGDRAFNYYDHKPGRIGRIDAHAQPDTMTGQTCSTPIEEWSNHWFDFQHDDGTSCSLDGSRICSIELAIARGWAKAPESVPCSWWALCPNDATMVRSGPVRDDEGKLTLGPIPICDSCEARLVAIEGATR